MHDVLKYRAGENLGIHSCLINGHGEKIYQRGVLIPKFLTVSYSVGL
jgi:hypothetical protein